MSVRRKKGEIIAISVSVLIALMLAAAMIFGSEHKRKKELEELHMKAMKEAAEKDLIPKTLTDKTSIQVTETTQKEESNSAKTAEPSTSGSTAEDDEAIAEANYKAEAEKNLEKEKEKEKKEQKERERKEKEEKERKEKEEKERQEKEEKEEKERKEKEEKERMEKERLEKEEKERKEKEAKSCESSSKTTTSEPVFDCKAEIEAIRRRILQQQQPPKPKPRKRHPSSTIIFDPVPGLFPKMFVDRFFKKRRVQVIMYGPKNAKKEYVVEGDKADKLFGQSAMVRAPVTMLTGPDTQNNNGLDINTLFNKHTNNTSDTSASVNNTSDTSDTSVNTQDTQANNPIIADTNHS